MSMKNSSDTIGNRTRDLSACSAVPPHAPVFGYRCKLPKERYPEAWQIPPSSSCIILFTTLSVVLTLL